MTRETAKIKVELLDNYLSHTCQDYGERDHEAMMMAIKALEQEPTIKALGEELRKARKGIADEKVLIGYNLAVAICNKHLGESEVEE